MNDIKEKDWSRHEKILYADGRQRCSWADPGDHLYIEYHDHEWGVPLHDDRKLFELLILEGFQAGLSWKCVLHKREAMRRAFDGFDPEKLAAYDEKKTEELMQDPSIIRNRRKIEAASGNARAFLEIRNEYGSFDRFLWDLCGGRVIYETGLTKSPLSDAVSAELRKRGMKFVGTTIIYAYLQAAGIINSHDPGCFLHDGSGDGRQKKLSEIK